MPQPVTRLAAAYCAHERWHWIRGQVTLFQSIYAHGFMRIAVGTPRVALVQPAVNVQRTIALAQRAAGRKAALVLFPELGLSAYSGEDLLLQDALLDDVERAVQQLLAASRALGAILIVGAPLRSEGRLFNCALVMLRGALLGVIPKTYLPNYREFYEKRQFTSATQALEDTIEVAGQRVPFGNDLLFACERWRDFVLHVEICEDLWVPQPPSTHAALGGATVLANLSASDATIGKAEYRRLLCASQSAKCIAAYAYRVGRLRGIHHRSRMGRTGDGLRERRPHRGVAAFPLRGRTDHRGRGSRAPAPGAHAHDELQRLRSARARAPRGSAPHRMRPRASGRRGAAREDGRALPLCSVDPASLDERCREVYDIQVQGLARRMEGSGINKLVIGVSGGLDSTQALMVAARAVDTLELPRANVLGFTLPGFATSERTRTSALRLMSALGVNAREVDIRPSAMQMFRDLGHPFARGESLLDVTFENVQAGERASHLFRLANFHGALVVGTSDLSELALGYTTYGVGDQMSHYAVNASVPKTLIRHLIHWISRSAQFDAHGRASAAGHPRHPHQPRAAATRAGARCNRPRASSGPYELQDFNLYYLSRFGFRPSKVTFLAEHAWSKRAAGAWPQSVPEAERHEYDRAAIKHWLGVFITRFFGASQFKRSAQPNAPKVGSGGSLSPRGDWRAPSDASADVWLEELSRNVP